jgi:hypothetical protein
VSDLNVVLPFAGIHWKSENRQELTSTGVPTGIERQKRFGRFLSWLLETVRLRNAHELGVGARAEN